MLAEKFQDSKFVLIVGRYTLVDKETLSLPSTPRSSFRQSVRKSLRKLKRKKKRQNNIAKKSNEEGGGSKYEIKVAIKEVDEDEDNIYDIVEPVSFDPVDETVDSNIVVIKEYSSRTYEKPSSIFDQKRSFQVPETNVSKNPSEVVDHKDIDSAQKDKESKLFPRGPLGDLLKQKSLNSEALKDQKCTNEAHLETADEETDKNVELEITDKEEINEEVRLPDSQGDEESNKEIKGDEEEARKTLLDEGSRFFSVLSETSLSLPRLLFQAFHLIFRF